MSDFPGSTQKELMSGRRSLAGKYSRLFSGRRDLAGMVWYELANLLFARIPGALGFALRRLAYPSLFGRVGRGVIFGRDVTFRHPHKIRLGDGAVIDDGVVLDAKGEANAGLDIGANVYLGRSAILSCKEGSIEVGDFCNISSRCTILSESRVRLGKYCFLAGDCYLVAGGNHSLDRIDVPIMFQPSLHRGGIDIGQDVWLGAGVIVLDGVTIGRGSVVGAGSVVTHSLPEYSVVTGSRVKKIGDRRSLPGTDDEGRPSSESGKTAGELESLQRQWNRFGEEDPLWSNLSCPSMRHGRWSPREFFETGTREVDALMAYVQTLEPAVGRSRALDFGCGAGRLTQALGGYFESCDGVDIAPSMIELARKLNARGDRCRFQVNAAADLKLFEDGRFDLVYSNIVLQHMPPELFAKYIREFVRVLAPEGVAVFQLPDEKGTRRVEAAGVPLAPLPESAFRARLKPAEKRLTAVEDSDIVLSVLVRNDSPVTWPARGEPGGRWVLNLANHWLDGRGRVLVSDDGRAQLPQDMAPGTEVPFRIWVRAPARPGRYLLELDMVQEDVSWFARKGSPTARVRVRVKAKKRGFPSELKSEDKPVRRPEDDPEKGPCGTKLPMYGARPQRVAAWVEEAGGKVVDLREDGQRGDWHGYLYTVSRSGARSAVDLAAALAAIAARDAETAAAARARLSPEVGKLSLKAGERRRVSVRVCNESPVAWQAGRDPAGAGAVRLGNHWLEEDGRSLRVDDGRADLEADLPPGGETVIGLDVRAPDKPGSYLLEFDMVREQVAWFRDLGSETARIPVRVS
ncbi:MAG: methyltransferase domain-containing protein [Candidatus Aminicenantes bacterium]|nr:methyltransferase domain-containing protein [Candidatus Aminicenantes bacterium]